LVGLSLPTPSHLPETALQFRRAKNVGEGSRAGGGFSEFCGVLVHTAPARDGRKGSVHSMQMGDALSEKFRKPAEEKFEKNGSSVGTIWLPCDLSNQTMLLRKQ
jgi:hypothetical protein